MTEQEKRAKIEKHIAKRNGYFIKMLISIVMLPVSFKVAELDGLGIVFGFVIMFLSMIVAMCFKALHQGMLYCPLCGTSFGYGSWMTGSMPYRCPHCGEKLSY